VEKIQIANNQSIRLTVIFVLALVVALVPRDILFDETHVVCIHYYLFGFQCPLCGMTRAVYEFIHLQFASAISYNMVVALLPFYLLMDIATIFFHQNWLVKVRKTVVILIIAGLGLLYIFRIVQHFN
jgi:hypothetical protein